MILPRILVICIRTYGTGVGKIPTLAGIDGIDGLEG